MTLEEKFWSKVSKTDGCWLWTGSRSGNNKRPESLYGSFYLGSGKKIRAHRYSYEISKGSIPEGMLVCHSCDTPLCVNPDHLWLGTSADNNKDCLDKGRGGQRRRTHCRKGHELTPDNILINTLGSRICKTCQRINRKIWNQNAQLRGPRIRRKKHAETTNG